MDNAILARAANEARGLAIDAIHACSSGHLGLPLGAAEIGAVLFGENLRLHPGDPRWLNRDRFILSAGHGSMFLYAWLHLAGFDLSLEDLKNFRQLHSRTPGHPEFGETAGVEATTGPLGQGIANGVGYAISGKMAAAKFNTPEHSLFDHHVVVLAGDGCVQEGVAAEAAALAGHLGLDNLILFYDSNDVTLDAMAAVTQSADTRARFEALGWDTVQIDGHDLDAIRQAVENAKANDNGRPKLIECKTEIGRGIAEVAGTAAAHGEGGAKFAEAARQGLGLPAGETFHVSPEVRAAFAERGAARAAAHREWSDTFESWKTAQPDLARQLDAALKNAAPGDLLDRIPEFPIDYADATRSAGGAVINAVAEAMPLLITGSADLFGSTKNYIKGGGDLSRADFTGRNLWYGIREHAMGAICNGLAYDGLFRPTGATFAVFADYLRPSIRLAALANLPVAYIFTHDSVGVGEDGPTHQPVETVSGLRVIPNLDVIRPGDPEEVAGAFAAAMERTNGPTALILTRQKVATQNQIPVRERREGVFRGAYVAVRESGPLEVILMASGSELDHAIQAAAEIGAGARVVSMPCMERFDRQSDDYRDSVLPAACRRRVAIEAGVGAPWHRYTGLDGRVLGIERFGISAPGGTVMKELGMTPQAVVEAARSA
ncbi:MAG: transketolase [Akkermansiaceae bacterium]|nr:transketolase [Akkermansiaceae bacterium]MCP5549586.1 transketolase [Akkermansiaceae bacterium]